jgi:hypothetical protein
MKIDAQRLIKTTSDLIGKYENVIIDRDFLINKAKKKFRDALIENGTFQFTKADENKLLQTLENQNFDHFYIKSKPLNEKINHITDKIQRAIQSLYDKTIDLNIIIIDNPSMNENAWAMPNGTILIGIYLLTQLENFEELYFIIAHEAGHVLKQHVAVHNNIEWMADHIITGFVSKIRMESNIIKFIGEITPSVALSVLKQQHFYKLLLHHDEYESDEIAAKVLYSLNMFPEKGCEFLTRLPSNDLESQSHPRPSDRIFKIRELPKPNQLVKIVLDTKAYQGQFKHLKQITENEIYKTNRKRLFIKSASIAAGLVCMIPIIVISYLLFTLPVSDNPMTGFLQENIAYLVFRLLIVAGIGLFGYGSYLVYEKTYQKLKGGKLIPKFRDIRKLFSSRNQMKQKRKQQKDRDQE